MGSASTEEHKEGSRTVGNMQGDSSSHCFGKRPRRQSTNLCSSRHLGAKCRLITISSAHPPRASPGDLAFGAPRYLQLLCFGGFPSLHHRQCKSPSQPYPRWKRRTASAQLPCARALRQTASIRTVCPETCWPQLTFHCSRRPG